MKRVLLLGCLLAVSISGLCEVRTFPVDGIVKPEQVYVSGERLYIVERVKITIYSLEDISEVASFGKEGEGPGEIRNRIFALYFREGEMIVPSAGKITFLTADGALTREIAMPVLRSGDICPVGKNFAGLRFQVEGKSFFLELAVFDSRGRIVRRLKRIHDDFQPGKGMRAFIPPTAFDVSGNTVISTFREDFVVTAFDAVGNERFTIRPPVLFTFAGDTLYQLVEDSYET